MLLRRLAKEVRNVELKINTNKPNQTKSNVLILRTLHHYSNNHPLKAVNEFTYLDIMRRACVTNNDARCRQPEHIWNAQQKLYGSNLLHQ